MNVHHIVLKWTGRLYKCAQERPAHTERVKLLRYKGRDGPAGEQ